MNRRLVLILLVLVLLSALCAVLGTTVPEPSTDSLSVLILHPGEGNAVLITCGGETLLLCLGDEEDGDDLDRYLNRHWLLRITHTLRAQGGNTETLQLGDALCLVDCTGELPTLSVTHGENRFFLRLSGADWVELQRGSSQSELLSTEDHSLRILSDGSSLIHRPDFSADGE